MQQQQQNQHNVGPQDSVGPEARFFAFLREGKFMIQQSRGTGRHVFYPRALAPETGADDLDWTEASGNGTVYSTTVVHRKPHRGGNYNLAVVELAEGPRMMARVEGCDPSEVKIGMSVKARVEVPSFGPHKDSDQPIVVFYPA